MGGLIFILIIGFGVVAAVWSIQNQKRNRAEWQRAATTLGLHFRPGGLGKRSRMSGHLDGFRVSVETVIRSEGNHSQTYTSFAAFYPSLKLGMKLKKQGALAKLGRLFGGQDLEVGDAEFDRAVVVRAGKPVALREFLTPSRRLRLSRFLKTSLNASVTDRSVRFEMKGMVGSAQLRSQIRRAVRLAECLSQDESSETNFSEAIDRKREGDLDGALELLERSRAMSPEDDHEAALVEGEILLATGDTDAAAAVLSPLAAIESSGDAESVGLVDLVEERRSRPATTPPPLPASVESASPTDARVGMTEVLESLFGGNLLSFEIQRKFDEELAGRPVDWKGELVNLTRFQSDRIFGSDPGVRATFDLAPIAGGSFYARTARAIVQLPSEAADELEDRDGITLRFRGVLAACDAFARTIFVRTGSWSEV